MKKLLLSFVTAAAFVSVLVSCGSPSKTPEQPAVPETFTLTRDQLLDKIKGGWAGQTIGCTYGGPTEFKFNGTLIHDYVTIKWLDGNVKWYYDNAPGLYDDIYMDLTFVDVFDRLGLDAPVDSFAMAFAHAGYMLWHANQAARYNILNGIMPPASGHWMNNPHADDIDYQIEADYSGLMSPGMPNAASDISDKIGHIMNYGDGWYGGVYVGAMYSLAFISDDIRFVVKEALKTIPEESRFYQCMNDVIGWYEDDPADWKQTWFECERKWGMDYGCPDGVFVPFNIDAVINCAYVLIGLLYGDGDFGRTMEIATRCGQDSDCNPATAAGILGTMIGYSEIPDEYRKNLREVEDRDFAYTTLSLNKVYEMSNRHALQMIERHGGTVDEFHVTLACQQPVPVRYESNFEGFAPIDKIDIRKPVDEVGDFTFRGSGIVFKGAVQADDPAYVAKVEMYIDGVLAETASLPASFTTRRHELFWKYRLAEGDHTVSFRWLNPDKKASVRFSEAVVYVNTEAS